MDNDDDLDTDNWIFNLTVSLMGKQATNLIPRPITPTVDPYRERFMELTEAIANGLHVSDSSVRGAYTAYVAACIDYFNTVDKIKAMEENGLVVYGYEAKTDKTAPKQAKTEAEAEAENSLPLIAAAVQPRGGSESAEQFTGEDVSVPDNARDSCVSVECATHG
jgi:hypothetical protein